MRWLFALALPFALQDPDEIERLVHDLGSQSIATREAADARLREIGRPAMEALRAKRGFDDPELRRRIGSILYELERPEREAAHDAEMRKRLVLGTGASLEFSVRPWGDGLILDTRACREGKVELTWDVRVFDPEWLELPVERCGDCSPEIVYVPRATRIRPLAAWTILWYSPYEVEFKEPGNGDSRQIGEFTLEVSWPWITVKTARDWPRTILDRTCTGLRFDVKPGAQPQYDMIGIDGGAGGGGRYGGRFGEKKPSWCLCRSGPSPLKLTAPPEMRRGSSTCAPGGDGYRIDQVSRIELVFQEPIFEEFELAGPALRRD